MSGNPVFLVPEPRLSSPSLCREACLQRYFAFVVSFESQSPSDIKAQMITFIFIIIVTNFLRSESFFHIFVFLEICV